MNKTISVSRQAGAEAGFSLTELMITLAILAVLSAFAYPSYLDYVQRSNRNDARASVSRVANDLERFFATNGTYTTDVTTTSLNVSGGVAVSDGSHYTITIAPGATADIATSYLISATASGAQTADDECKTLTLDSAGRRTPAPATSDCW